MNPNPELREAIARKIIERMGPLVGSPEYLADPVKRARAEKRQRDAAESYAQLALDAVAEAITPEETGGWRPDGADMAQAYDDHIASCGPGYTVQDRYDAFRAAYFAAAPKAPGGDDSPARDLGTPAGSGEILRESAELAKMYLHGNATSMDYDALRVLLSAALKAPPTDPLPNTTGGER